MDCAAFKRLCLLPVLAPGKPSHGSLSAWPRSCWPTHHWCASRCASAAFLSSSTFGRPICCPRARRASRAAARRSRPSSSSSSARLASTPATLRGVEIPLSPVSKTTFETTPGDGLCRFDIPGDGVSNVCLRNTEPSRDVRRLHFLGTVQGASRSPWIGKSGADLAFERCRGEHDWWVRVAVDPDFPLVLRACLGTWWWR